jgi:hypothetical protein
VLPTSQSDIDGSIAKCRLPGLMEADPARCHRNPLSKALSRAGSDGGSHSTRGLGVHPETLRNCVTQAEVDEGHRPGTTTDEGKRVAELVREVKESRRANDILKTVWAFSPRRSSTAD